MLLPRIQERLIHEMKDLVLIINLPGVLLIGKRKL
jgi:hypothetical protein